MRYDEALKVWGAKRLNDRRAEARALAATSAYFRASYDDRLGMEPYDPSTVSVTMNFDKGNPCCGGSNADCYCSQATSPTADVYITGRTFDDCFWSLTIDLDDFATVLGEICDAAGGTMTGTSPPAPPLPWPVGKEPQL
jgi:hypothetical protein